MKRLTAEWVRKAEADRAAAEKLAKIRPRLNDPVCFHCQQTAEKYLKALMQEFGLTVPRTHDLEQLLDLLVPHDSTLRVRRRGLSRLTEYAGDYRYPGAHATSRQTQSALRVARHVREVIREHLGLEKRPKRRK
jgi:HEPN domain-containing protein